MTYSVPRPRALLQVGRLLRAGRGLRVLTALVGLVRFGGFTAACAQIDPEDTGAGDKLGLTQQRNSGQIGTVTLLKHGPRATLVIIALAAEPPGHSEPAFVRRGRSCDDRTLPAFSLAPVVNGASRTIVAAPVAKLLSGNYVVVVSASARARASGVSCGQLYR